MKTFLVNEIFLSISGEGPDSGKPTIFVRLFGCNLRCCYCDSMYSVEGSDYTKMTQREIVEEVKRLKGDRKTVHIILTGGEPILQLTQPLLMELYGIGSVEIETNGGVEIPDWVHLWASCTVDYKSLYSKMNDKMIVSCFTELGKNRDNDCIKCVVANRKDYEDFKSFIMSNSIRNNVTKFLSPVFGCVEPKDIVSWMLEDSLDDTWRMQLQMHKFIWDPDKRGV